MRDHQDMSWATIRRSSWASALLLLAVGCATESADPAAGRAVASSESAKAASSRWNGRSYRLQSDAAARCRFPVPATGAELRSRHFSAELPANKLRHELTVLLDGAPLVRIDVWDDPLRQPVDAWFAANLAGTRSQTTLAEHRTLTARAVEGLVLVDPASPQSPARTAAIVAMEGRVFRVTCLDSDRPEARSVCEELLAGLEPEETP